MRPIRRIESQIRVHPCRQMKPVGKVTPAALDRHARRIVVVHAVTDVVIELGKPRMIGPDGNFEEKWKWVVARPKGISHRQEETDKKGYPELQEASRPGWRRKLWHGRAA